jgi:hypothetical protein
LNDSIFDDLRPKINDNPSKQEKLMIVDRFKAIFSYHINIELTDSQKNRRGYMNLLGYDKTTEYPLDNTYKNKVLKELED